LLGFYATLGGFSRIFCALTSTASLVAYFDRWSINRRRIVALVDACSYGMHSQIERERATGPDRVAHRSALLRADDS